MTDKLDWICVDIESAVNIERPYMTKKELWERMYKGEAGLSIAVTWDSRSEEYELYDTHTLDELVADLDGFSIISAFNHEFDIGVITSLTGRPLNGKQILDPLVWMKEHYGGPRLGTKLANLSEMTLGMTKLGNGKSTYAMWENLEIAKLFRYCRHDVMLTRELVWFARDNGYLMGPSGRCDLTLPDWIGRLA